MNQASENGEKPNSGRDFDSLGPNLGIKHFFCGFFLCQMLDFVASYHRIQFQEKSMIQTQENGKKRHVRSDLGLSGPK